MRSEFCWCDCFRASSCTLEEFTMPFDISWRSILIRIQLPNCRTLSKSHCHDWNTMELWPEWTYARRLSSSCNQRSHVFCHEGSKEVFQWHVPCRKTCQALFWTQLFVLMICSDMFEIRRVWMMTDDGLIPGWLFSHGHDMPGAYWRDLWMHFPPILVSNWNWYSCRVTFSKGAVVFCTFLALAHQLSLIGLCLLLLGQIDRTFCSCTLGTHWRSTKPEIWGFGPCSWLSVATSQSKTVDGSLSFREKRRMGSPGNTHNA